MQLDLLNPENFTPSQSQHLAALDEEAQRRYLNYAMSVITSRALPDVRDGLKPVQRRILYAMYHDQKLLPDAKFRKCASVVGDVLGKYHPHGDGSVYDALVRMAQDFSLRYPLVQGHGNFGSQDGDAAAAYRYTECRLQQTALSLLAELEQNTVGFRPTFDGVRFEPMVLPAQLPNLLLNGAQGIAVGMATSIPPHNAKEILGACQLLIEKPDAALEEVLKHVKGPDFPTYGEILCSKQDVRALYEKGHGSLRLQAEYRVEDSKENRGVALLIIHSIPYGLTRAAIMEKIGDLILSKKVPFLLGCKDESSTEVRMVVEIKKGTDPALAMEYLYRNTSLRTFVHVNLTCLVPTDQEDICVPKQLSLLDCLRAFLRFRFDVITRRLRHEQEGLYKRIHLLAGLVLIYDALDEVLQIIRKSDGKKDAAKKLMARFRLDAEQVDAILELKLYRLARLEINVISEELKSLQNKQTEVKALLATEKPRWDLVQSELAGLQKQYGDKRRTRIGVMAEEPAFDPDALVVAEDAYVILTRQGWVKRVSQIKDISSIRVREQDEVLTVLGGSTRSSVTFFTNMGIAYTCKIEDIPPSTGYGDPLQKWFAFANGELVVAAFSHDNRFGLAANQSFLAVSMQGLGLRFFPADYEKPSTRNGRKVIRLAEKDYLLQVLSVKPEDALFVVSAKGRALVCAAGEINLLSQAGKGVQVMKLEEEDHLVGVSSASIQIETEQGKSLFVTPTFRGKRGSKGQPLFKRGRLAKVLRLPPTIPAL